MTSPKTLASDIAQILFRNLGWKLLSLALAAIVWIAIHHEPIIFSVIAAPVQFKNAPRDLEISSEIVESVDMEVRGPAQLLRNLGERRLAVVLDFTSVREAGERTFTVERQTTNLPRGVELVRVIPSQLHFVFERRLVRRVPVAPQVSGILPKGLHLVSVVSVPAELAITGPESKVKGVISLRTDPVDLTGLAEDKNARVTAYLPNSQVRFKDSPEVTVKVSLTK
ncbi:MAG TPA: CdaR family protein [Bryobacteraceae bacterium]|jgi:YbbR domain-containing protein